MEEYLVESHLGGYYITSKDKRLKKEDCSECLDSDKILTSWEKDNKSKKIEALKEYFISNRIKTKEELMNALFYYGLEMYGLEDTIEELEYEVSIIAEYNNNILRYLRENNNLDEDEESILKKEIINWEREQLQFIRNYDYSRLFYLSPTDLTKDKKNGLRTIKNKYELIENRINTLNKKIQTYEKSMNKKTNKSELNLNEELALYQLLVNNDKNKEYKNISLNLLLKKLLNIYPELKDYLDTKEEISKLETKRDDILLNKIVFKENKKSKEDKHILISTNKGIECVECGTLVSYYSHSTSDIEFLCLCAKKQGLLVEGACEKDLSLLKVLLTDENNKQNKNLISNLTRKVNIAHNLDSNNYDLLKNDIKNPKYLTKDETQKLLKEIQEERKEVLKKDSLYNNLLLESLDTAYYEVLILSGANIPKMIDNITEEKELIGLSKAIYNLSNLKYRTNSDYFSNNKKGVYSSFFNDYLTSRTEVNEKILELKSRG